MKRFIYILLFTLGIFGFTNDAYAKEIFRCKYQYNFNQILPAIADVNIEFWMIIDITNNKQNLSISDFNNVSEAMNGFNIAWISGFKESYLNDAISSKSCPDIAFAYDGGGYQINGGLYKNGTQALGENPVKVTGIKVVDDIELGNSGSNIKEVCKRYKSLRNESYSIAIKFFYENNVKMWELTKADGSNADIGKAKATEPIGYEGYVFYLRDDVINTFYNENSCSTSDLYLQTSDSNRGANFFQMTKPGSEENGSFNANTAQNDNGKTDLTYELEEIDREYSHGCSMLGGKNGKTIKLISEIYGHFTWIIPLLIVILSILDFIRVVALGEEKEYKKALDNLKKRIVIGIIFFLVPVIVKLLINITGITDNFENGDSIIETIVCVLK